MEANTDDAWLRRVAAAPYGAAPPNLLVGSRRFELRRHLGAGSFGEVFEARDRESGAIVALKILKASEPDRLFRFKREFRAVADLAHPNLVRLHELVQEGDRWMLAMELVEGLPFSEHVRRAPEQTRACFTQLAEAIETLHQARCVHRDIKPTNVLVERTGRVVLLDFGLALALDATDDTAIAGTPHYMAPEQMTGKDLSPACDWYALGVMLYQTLAGRLPFDGSGERLWREKRRAVAPPSRHRDGVDADLEQLCVRLLAPSPGDRPHGADVLAVLAGRESELESATREREPFAGRTRELVALGDALSSVEDEGALVLLHGHAGNGKTSLAQTFARDAAKRGALWFEGRCHEAESVPFKGIDSVVDAISEHLRRIPSIEAASRMPRDASALATMFPVLKRVEAFAHMRPQRLAPRGPGESRRAAIAGLRELLARMSDAAPLVVFVDDAQWATEDGMRLLLEVLAPPVPPVLFVLAYRREAVGRSAPLDELLAGARARGEELRVRELSVDPLTRDEVGALLAASAGGSELDADALFRETGGHPLLLTRVLRAGGLEARDAGLAAALDRQFEALGPEARAVLEHLSITAAPLTQGAALEAAGTSAWDPRVLDELRAVKLVRSFGRSPRALVEPFHDQVRERLVAGMAPERARSVHRQLARYFERHGRADPDAIAHHYAEADEPKQAAHWMRVAARAALTSLAFARAAELLGKAAEICADKDLELDLLAEQAEAMALAGRRGDAGRAYLRASEVACAAERPRREAELRALAGEHFMLGGDFRRGKELLTAALAEVGVDMPTSTGVAMAQALNMQVELVARGLDFSRTSDVDPAVARRVDLTIAAARSLAQSDIRAPWLSASALHDALELGDPHRVLGALGTFAFVNASRLSHHPLGDDVLARADALAHELHDDAGIGWVVLSRGYFALFRRDIQEAVDRLEEAERIFLALPRPLLRETGIARAGLTTAWGYHGHDLPRARERTRTWLADALEREDLAPATWLRLMGVWIDLAGDDVREARGQLQLAREAWTDVEDEVFTAVAVIAELGIAAYEDPASAWEVSERLAPVFGKLFASLLVVPRLGFNRLRASVALCAYRHGRADRATTEARVRACMDALAGNPNAVDALTFLEGQLAALRGELREAVQCYTRAADGMAARDQRTYELLVELRRAQALGEDAGAFDAELRALGVVNPDRFGQLFFGPAPRDVTRDSHAR